MNDWDSHFEILECLKYNKVNDRYFCIFLLFFFNSFCCEVQYFKFILQDFVELRCLGAFLVVATVDSSFQKLET